MPVCTWRQLRQLDVSNARLRSAYQLNRRKSVTKPHKSTSPSTVRFY